MSFVEFSNNFNSFPYRCFSNKKVAGKIRKLLVRLSRIKETLKLWDYETWRRGAAGLGDFDTVGKAVMNME